MLTLEFAADDEINRIASPWYSMCVCTASCCHTDRDRYAIHISDIEMRMNSLCSTGVDDLHLLNCLFARMCKMFISIF